MTIIHVDRVEDINGIVVHAFNKLLRQHAMDQHMLASSDEGRTQRIHDLLTKNVELEAENRKLKETLQLLVGSPTIRRQADAMTHKQGAPAAQAADNHTTSYGDDLTRPKGQPYSYVERDQV